MACWGVVAGVAVVLALAVLALSLWPTEPTPPAHPVVVPTALPAPAAPLVAEAEPSPPPAAAPATADAAVAASPPDAGLVDVTFELLRGGEHVAGERLWVHGPGGSEGRSTDVMGFAQLNLPAGRWLVESYELVLPVAVEIKGVHQRVRLELPVPRTIVGIVRDFAGAPVAGARVQAWGDGDRPLGAAITGEQGGFLLDTPAEFNHVTASRPPLRSPEQFVHAPATGVVLVVLPWVSLDVVVSNARRGPLTEVQVLHQGQLVATGEGRWVEGLKVPVGRLEVWARQAWPGELWRGSAEIETSATKQNATVEVQLKAVGPLRGVVKDRFGRALADVSVQARVAAEMSPDAGGPPRRSAAEVSVDGGTPLLHVAGSALTSTSGDFSILPEPALAMDPAYELTTGPPWRPLRRTLVRLGDAPLWLIVEPGTPP